MVHFLVMRFGLASERNFHIGKEFVVVVTDPNQFGLISGAVFKAHRLIGQEVGVVRVIETVYVFGVKCLLEFLMDIHFGKGCARTVAQLKACILNILN